jgi:hypothetical protein
VTKTIRKAVLNVTEEQRIAVPAGAEFLTAREEYGQVCVWFLCDPAQPFEERTILIRETTEHLVDGRYIASAQIARDSAVFHFFEK